MCLAAWLGASRRLTRDEIENAWDNNPDGAGFVYFDDRERPVVYRTLRLAKFVRAYEIHAARGRAMAVHFRYGTHGTNGVENVHPFRINRTDWLLHNGVIHIPTDGRRSDTRTFAEDYLAKLPARWWESAELSAVVADFVRGSKLIIATTDPDASSRFSIINADDGHWEDDRVAWFSNRSHCAARLPAGSTAGSNWSRPSELGASLFGWPTDRDCPVCGLGIIDGGVCDACETCAACLRDLPECECGGASLRMLALTDDEWNAYQGGTR